jgi:predicted AlkP superfamily pyrophosphatase or phosphodiesterase
MLAALFACACASPIAAPPPVTAVPTAAKSVHEPTPRLVVVVIIDQLGSWVLEKYLPYLDENGALRRGIARGSHHVQVAYEFALTLTAPGHAATFTGAPPAISGVTTNTYYDVESGKTKAFISDGVHAVFNDPERSASPSVLRVPTVGDALKATTGGKARVVSISGKDRAAILMGGRSADLALWFDHRSRSITTSSYYAPAIPPWVVAHQHAHPLAALLTTWTPGDEALLARAAGPDDGAGEGDYLHLGVRFPHDPNAAGEDKWDALRLFPQLSEYVIGLAGAAAAELELGRDDVPDLLALSVSGLDYTGHTFGPDSWEYLDHLRRIDAALGTLLATLERERGPIAVLITSDHGVAPTPAQNPESGGRVYPAELERLAREAWAAAGGKPDSVRAFVRPFLYLDPELRDGAARDEAVGAIRNALEAHAGVHMVVDVRAALGWRDDPDRIKRAIGLAVADGTPGDIFVLLAPGWVLDEDEPTGAGTTHGTPWDYDRLVPVIIWGANVAHARHPELVSQTRVAPTIARLLGIAPPPHANAPDLLSTVP